MFVNRLVVDIILHLNVLENKHPSKSKLVQSKCGCEFTDKWHPQHWATMNSADSPVSPLYTLPSYTWVYTSSIHGQNYACDTPTHSLKPHALSSHTYISTKGSNSLLSIRTEWIFYHWFIIHVIVSRVLWLRWYLLITNFDGFHG